MTGFAELILQILRRDNRLIEWLPGTGFSGVPFNGGAFGMNQVGTIAGNSWRWEGSLSPFIRNPDDTIMFLPINLDQYSHCGTLYAINDSNEVAGSLNGASLTRAVLWRNNSIVYLNDSADNNSKANSINNSTHVVGNAIFDNSSQHAFIWNGVMLDLNNFLPDNSGWELAEAYGINDLDQANSVALHVL